ncbi:hypothetical protein ACNOYE_05700 [Nannocystaceae bacterium ST9]
MILLALAPEALAGPPTSGASKPNPSSQDTGFKLPDFVYGGNAISLLAPVQVGIVGYVPRGRIGIQYDRQIHRAHWVHIGVAGLFDRGGYKDFRMPSCGMDNQTGTCDAGTVAGADVWLGYTYKLYIEKAPFLVPIFRGGLAGGFWKYPNLYGTREQSRELSWTLGFQAGVGLRLFLLRELAIGLDVEFRPSLMIHRNHPPNQGIDKDPAFSLPIQILPLIVEWRF